MTELVEASDDVQEVHRNPDNKVSILKMDGSVITEVKPVPLTVQDLKARVWDQVGTPVLLQRLIKFGDVDVLEDEEPLEDEMHEFMLVIDETNMWMWDVPDPRVARIAMCDLVHVSGAHATAAENSPVNLQTKEPVRSGRHYFEFVIHKIGAEQAYGVIKFKPFCRVDLRDLHSWSYYSGRMQRQVGGTIVDGLGALHAKGKAVTQFRTLSESGGIIGMLVDMEMAAIAFSLNGEVQGACAIEVDSPLYVLTHLGTPQDHVELRKPHISSAPQALSEALTGPLLDITAGESLRPRSAMQTYGFGGW